MTQLQAELQELFQRVFDDDALELTADTSAADVDGWDSMAHINLIVAIEKRFAIRFSATEIGELARHGQNVGNMLQLIRAKTGRHEQLVGREDGDSGGGPNV